MATPWDPDHAMYLEWAKEWNSSLATLHRELGLHALSEAQQPLSAGAAACSVVATRHIAKTGGVSVREWMLRLEQQQRARYYGPATWMKFRGRCSGQKRYLFCCLPSDLRGAEDCKVVPLTRARFLALHELRRRSWLPMSTRRAPHGRGFKARGGGGEAASADALAGSAVALASSAAARGTKLQPRATSLALLEFHWPDSALGRWGEPHTFLQMLPRMRPHALPGCRVVVTTVLRDPLTLYPSLQRHQYDAMREYGREALRARCGCNLTSCDVLGFVRAFPNFQAWRLTSSRWVVPPLELVGHDALYDATVALLKHVDVVGVTERLDDFLQLVCARAGIAPCGHVGHLNAQKHRASTRKCTRADPAELRSEIDRHARADVRLHARATTRFDAEWRQHLVASTQNSKPMTGGGTAQNHAAAPATLFEEDRLAP